MSPAYGPRASATKLTLSKGKTLGQILTDNGLDSSQLNLVTQYNWGTKVPAEVNRALVELVGCERLDPDPLESVIDPGRGTGGQILKPEPWTPTLPVSKTHTVKVRKRMAPTAVGLELPAFFDPTSSSPATAQIDIKYTLEGDASRATTKDLEIRATGYFTEVKDREGMGTNLVEKPSGTATVDDVSESRIYKSSAPGAPGPSEYKWDGGSDAAVGILKKPAKINSACAPYFVTARFYKDPADKTAFLQLEPFYPRWKLTGKSTWELDEASLIVKWKKLDQPWKEKLKQGQIQVHDKDGLVFFAPLTQEQIAGGTYDLLKAPIAWDKSKLDPKQLPYRIQLQAHSDAEEENGLALAVMPTQVPAYNYDQVQFIGFNVRNDVTPDKKEYLGDVDSDVDIDFRVAAMIEAIQLAAPKVDKSRNILKVFMGPEFYFRGQKGAYPIGDLSTIVPKMRKETDKSEYLDWLFVFGTALGQQAHSEGAKATRHGKALHRVQIVSSYGPNQLTVKAWQVLEPEWVFQTATLTYTTSITAAPSMLPNDAKKDPIDGSYEFTITVADATGFAPLDLAEAVQPLMKILETVPPTTSPTKKIKVASADCGRIPVDPATHEVVAVAGLRWQVVTSTSSGYVTAVDEVSGSYILTLDAEGNYAAGDVMELVEPITVELYNVALMQKGWHAPHVKNGLREVITYKEDLSHIDFIQKYKGGFYEPKNRKIRLNSTDDVALLPTTGGKDIGGASPNVKRKTDSVVGSEINQDGRGGGCVMMLDRITFGMEVCRDHCVHRIFNFYTGKNVVAGDPQIQVHLIPSWGMSIGMCDAGKEVSALRDGLVFNVDGSRMESVARVWDTSYSCDDHVTNTNPTTMKCTDTKILRSAGKVYVYCKDCNTYRFPACPIVGHTASPCDTDYQQIGTALVASSTDPVPKTNHPKYFKNTGNVQVFPAKPLPPPDVAKAPVTLTSIANGNAKPNFRTTITLKAGAGLSETRGVFVDAPCVVESFKIVSDTEVQATIYVKNWPKNGTGPRDVTIGTYSGRSNAMTFTIDVP